MTGLASMLSNCPKTEKDREELPDSFSDLILSEELLLTRIFLFLLLQHSSTTMSSIPELM
jgi:hypothetical protein